MSGPNGNLMYADELLQSRQLLPCWDRERGRLTWLSPHEALAQVRQVAGSASAGADVAPLDGNSVAKRARTSQAAPALSALGSYGGLQQGVLQPQMWGNVPGYADLGAPSMPRVPSSTSAAPAPAASMLPDSLDFAQLTPDMLLGGGSGSGVRPPRGRANNNKRGYGLDLALPRGNAFSAGLGLESMGGFNASGNLSSLNLGDMLRSASLSEIDLRAFGNSFSDLGALGLSFSKGQSDLKEVNASDISLSGLLGESASDIVSGLGNHQSSMGNVPQGATYQAGSGNGFRRPHEQLAEIMSEFGPMSGPNTVGTFA